MSLSRTNYGEALRKSTRMHLFICRYLQVSVACVDLRLWFGIYWL